MKYLIAMLLGLIGLNGCGHEAVVESADCSAIFDQMLSGCGYANCAWGLNADTYTLDSWNCESGTRSTLTPVGDECVISTEPLTREWGAEWSDSFGSAADNTCTLADWDGGSA